MLVNSTSQTSPVIPTVRSNYDGYTKSDVTKAHESHRLQTMIGCPSPRDYTGVVHSKLLLNCPITPTDIANAHDIFCPNLASLHRKTVRHKPQHVYKNFVTIPKDIMTMHKMVTLVADVMFVNGIPFLTTLSIK